MDDFYDYQYSDDAREADVMILWKCDECEDFYEDYPGINEACPCECGGRYRRAGESYLA